jgi:DNA-binding HxlR family transcriptional regulator
MARTHEKVRYPPKSNLNETPGHTKDDWSADAAEEAFKLLEGRWKMMIVFHLFDKSCMRFSELERAIPLVSQKMLIQQLRDLESKGIVTRTIYQEVPLDETWIRSSPGIAGVGAMVKSASTDSKAVNSRSYAAPEVPVVLLTSYSGRKTQGDECQVRSVLFCRR